MLVSNRERHRTGTHRWLRAAGMDANDAILVNGESGAWCRSGLCDSQATCWSLGVAGMVAGIMSMAAGDTCLSTPADTERADLALERAELKADDKGRAQGTDGPSPSARGLDPSLAKTGCPSS